MQLRKKKTCDGDWIVANDSTGGHAHFDTKFGADTIIFLLNNNIEPSNPYFVESKRRLLKSSKTREKKRKKCKYINKLHT